MPLDPLGKHRLITAFLLAPLTPSAIVMLIAVAGARLGEGLWACMIVLPVSYCAAVFPGIPLYFLTRRLQTCWVFCMVGISCALAASAALWWATFADRLSGGDASGWMPFLGFSIVAAVFGALAGYVFWRVMRPAQVSAPGR